MGHTRQQYEDRIRSMLGDLGVIQLLREESIPLALEAALSQFSADKPRQVEQSFDGDGSVFDFDLTVDGAAPTFDVGWSRLIRVEYPAGERVPVYLDDHKVLELDDGVVRLLETTPESGTDNVVIRYTTPWEMPTDAATDDEIADVYFPAVCALAGARMAAKKAGEFSRRQSSSVSVDLIQHRPEPLWEAARSLERIYTDTVLGRSSGDGAGAGPPQVAYATGDVDVFSGALFHRRDGARTGAGQGGLVT